MNICVLNVLSFSLEFRVVKKIFFIILDFKLKFNVFDI